MKTQRNEVGYLDNIFSTAARAMRPSDIRALKKRLQDKDVISLVGGEPSPDAIPVDEIRGIFERFTSDFSADSLKYGLTTGNRELREEAQKILEGKGISCAEENVILTNGSQRALDLAGRVLIDPGDVVFIEAPTYSGAIACFRNLQAELVPVAVDENGLNIEALEQAIGNARSAGKRPKLLYTIPNYQNPTGYTLSADRRKELSLIAERENIIILEDDPYGEIWFGKDDSSPTRPIASHCKRNCLYLAGFSKTVAPGLRTAFLYGPRAIISAVENAAQAADLVSGSIDQMLILELLKSGTVDGAMGKARRLYKEQYQVMLSSLTEFMPEGVSWSKPGGGFFIWLELPDNINAEILLNSAIDGELHSSPADIFTRTKAVRIF